MDEAPNAVSKDERLWAMIVHLSSLAMYVTGIGYIVGPLIVWLLKRDGHPFVDDQGKEAINFQISITIYAIVGAMMIFTVILALPAIFLLSCLHLFQLICIIIAGIKANDGVAFRYPATIRFLK